MGRDGLRRGKIRGAVVIEAGCGVAGDAGVVDEELNAGRGLTGNLGGKVEDR